MVRDIELRTLSSKNMYLSRDFLAMQKSKHQKCAYVNACLHSTDNQSPR